MKMVIIHNTDKWRVDSYGNGIAYLLTNKANITNDPSDYELHFQGDSATEFREQIEAMEELDYPYNRLFQFIWNDHK